MLTFFNRSHTESVTVDYCDFPEDALQESVECLTSSGFKFYCLHLEVANWMQVDASSVEEIRKRIRHAQKNEMFCSKSTAGIIHVIGFTFNLFPASPSWMDGILLKETLQLFLKGCRSFSWETGRDCNGRRSSEQAQDGGRDH